MLNKKNILWILLFGTLIGLNETLIGSFKIPYRAVILSTITITLLSIAARQIPKIGTSTLVILIAVIFKLNNMGFATCTVNVFFCGPSAILLLGIGYEAFSSLLNRKITNNYLKLVLICGLTSIAAFTIFGIMNTYILNSWNESMFSVYLLSRAPMTVLASGALSIFVLFLFKTFRNYNIARLNPYVINSAVVCMIIAIWLFGTFTQL